MTIQYGILFGTRTPIGMAIPDNILILYENLHRHSYAGIDCICKYKHATPWLFQPLLAFGRKIPPEWLFPTIFEIGARTRSGMTFPDGIYIWNEISNLHDYSKRNFYLELELQPVWLFQKIIAFGTKTLIGMTIPDSICIWHEISHRYYYSTRYLYLALELPLASLFLKIFIFGTKSSTGIPIANNI